MLVSILINNKNEELCTQINTDETDKSGFIAFPTSPPRRMFQTMGTREKNFCVLCELSGEKLLSSFSGINEINAINDSINFFISNEFHLNYF